MNAPAYQQGAKAKNPVFSPLKQKKK